VGTARLRESRRWYWNWAERPFIVMPVRIWRCRRHGGEGAIFNNGQSCIAAKLYCGRIHCGQIRRSISRRKCGAESRDPLREDESAAVNGGWLADLDPM